jgi:hypothetical protein
VNAMPDRPETTEPHPWYGPCDSLLPDGRCAECATQATLREVYKLVVWGTHYEDVPFEEAMARPRYQHLKQLACERTLVILDSFSRESARAN